MPFNVSVSDWRGLDAFRTPTEAQMKKRQYKQHEQLGQGGFGRVLRAEWRNPDDVTDKRDVALKIINKARVNESLPVEAEIEVLRDLKHEHIVRLYDSFETKHSFYLAFELATGGELFERIRKGRYPEAKAAGCIRQILSGIAYLHANRIVHRDIKPENIMYRTPAPTSPLVIVDFGIAKFIDNLTEADGPVGDESEGEDGGEARAGQVAQAAPVFGDEEAASNMAGTFGYASPEALRGRRPACKMDMWSIGIISYQLLGGYRPFRGRSKEEMIRVTLKGKVQFNEQYWSGISDSAKDFVKALLVVDPEKRMSAEEALRHPWLTSMAPAPPSTATSRTNSTNTSPTRPNASASIPTSTSISTSAQAGPSSHASPSRHPKQTSPISPAAPASLPDTPESDRASLIGSSDRAGKQEEGEEVDVDSDDEGFFTPDEGDDDGQGGAKAISRIKSRKSLRKRPSGHVRTKASTKEEGGREKGVEGQVPDAKQTLAVDTSGIASTARPTVQRGASGASAPVSASSSQRNSPTAADRKGGTAAPGAAGGGLKGMMGKLGLGMGSAK